ncbi:MAG TPA: glycoside hydrolase family 3 C-terminal domain-containing protein [Anaerolineales bacterium]|nr:glycoside hydrolase family 3 C-terminal domain-containing protein [Anaerolineales bacterium]
MVNLEELIQQMTIEEKISLLAGADLWRTVPVPRLGIPQLKVTDGPNGARGAWGNLGPTSDLIPVGIALGATWNTELVEKIGALLAEEIQAKGAHILLGPTVNIHRTPIAGRNFECYSEDPFLSGRMASAYIRGIQNHGAGACIKHFVCNDQDFERRTISAKVEERPLHEIYLEPFRLAVRDAKPWAVMSSYNRVNGIPASQNQLTLKKILKEQWGFDGLVISDWFGTYSDHVPCGGLDLEMPGPGRWMSAEIVRNAMEKGELTIDELNDKVRRILRVIGRSGAFERPDLAEERSDDSPGHRRLIREAARETIVLLANRNDILPLVGPKIKTIAVIGELAGRPNVMGGGSSQVTPHYVVSPLEGIRARASASKVRVEYAIGCFVHKSLPAMESVNLLSEDNQRGLTLRMFDNSELSGAPAYSEVIDRFDIGWFDKSVKQANQENFNLTLTGSFVAKAAGLHTFSLSSVGPARLSLNGKVLLDNWDAYVHGAEKTVRRRFTAGQKAEIKVEYRCNGNRFWRSLKLGHLPPYHENLMDEAVALAKRSDVVVIVAGLSSEWEAEGFDRVNMELPGEQNELIERVAAANPNTIVVLNAGSPVSMPWVRDVAGILEQWYNSQECGNALADVVFGDVNPSGKLPTTFPVRYEDNPAFINYPGENGEVVYGEGLFVGYRYYDAKGLDPLFPFGHGLSYTRFDYSDLQLKADRFTEESGLDVSLNVRNSGTRAGQEIIQLYIHDVESNLRRPEKELKAFCKILLEAGETKTVSFHLDKEAFWYYDPVKGGWTVEPGDFEIIVGASSRDLRLRTRATLIAPQSSSRFRLDMTLREIMEDEAGKIIIERYLGEWLTFPESHQKLDLKISQLMAHGFGMLTPATISALTSDLTRA